MAKNKQTVKDAPSASTTERPGADNGKWLALGRRSWLLPGAVLFGVVLIGIAVILLRPAPQTATTAPGADPTLGPSTAPVTIIEYGDFG